MSEISQCCPGHYPTGTFWVAYHDRYADGSLALVFCEPACDICADDSRQFWIGEGKSRDTGFVPGIVTEDREVVEDLLAVQRD